MPILIIVDENPPGRPNDWEVLDRVWQQCPQSPVLYTNRDYVPKSEVLNECPAVRVRRPADPPPGLLCRVVNVSDNPFD